MIKLATPLNELKGIGPKFFERLNKLNIQTVKDLLWHFPFRYEDFSEIKKITDLKINERATIQGVITAVKLKRTWKRRMFIVEALISDDTGTIKAVWFNQRFLLSILKKGKLVNLAGKAISDSNEGIALTHPIYELVTQGFTEKGEAPDTKHTGRLIPIYSETKRVTSKMLRFFAKSVLENLEKLDDPIPAEILEKHNFPEINSALNQIHFPETLRQAQGAKKRFSFEDLFFLQLANLRQRLALAKQKTYSFPTDIEYVKSLISKLPFELTKSQKMVLWEILKDIEKSHPMNRLLQGDVGSGKTIVAALAALVVARENKQSAFMAPTEVLARQHYETFKRFFADFDKGVGLLTSAESKVFYGDGLESEIKKGELVKKIAGGEVKIVIGTHALIQKNIKFNDLAFVVIDEQHRFGVRQRAELIGHRETKFLPHFLSMSATPIPRTLSLTIFGDLDLSIIDELPKGRKEIITKIVAPANRDKAYAFIRGQVKKGRQVFVICPRIEPTTNDQPPTTGTDFRKLMWMDVRAVKEEYEKLSKKVFPNLKVEMLHGKMKAKEKIEVMKNFKEGGIDGLTSLTINPEQSRRIELCTLNLF